MKNIWSRPIPSSDSITNISMPMYLYANLCIIRKPMYLYVYLCIHMYTYVFIRISMYLYAYPYIYIYNYVFIYISKYLYVYLCIYMYTYVCICNLYVKADPSPSHKLGPWWGKARVLTFRQTSHCCDNIHVIPISITS